MTGSPFDWGKHLDAASSLRSTDDQADASHGVMNWEARLARSLIESAHKTKARAVAVGIVAAAWLILTLSGSFLASNESSVGGRVGDALYNALTFLAPRDGYSGVGRFAPLPPLLWWGRFFGVALSMLAFVWAALYRWRGMFACFLIRSRAQGHIIILSANGFADALARGRAEDGHCVVLVERAVSAERIIDLGRAGVVVMPEEASLAGWLHNCRVKNAAVVICWTESDSLGLANAFEARRAIGRRLADIIVRLDSPEMQRSLRSAPELLLTDQGRLTPVSPTIASVRAAFAGPGLVRDAIEQQHDRVHVALHGDTPTLGIVASFVLRHNWSMHLCPPSVTWIAGADMRAWQDWQAHNYCLLKHVAAAFGEDEPPSITATDGPSAAYSRAISTHIVDLGDDDRTMAAAFDLASRLAQAMQKPPPVQVILRNAHAVRELLQHSQSLAFAEPILIDFGTSFTTIARREDEAAEARIHRAYTRQGRGEPPPISEWLTLGETYVHANRAASDHVAIKEYDVLRSGEVGMDQQSVLETLARIEHLRWMVERLLDGWAPAAIRNNDRRLHDKLLPWASLSGNDREKGILAIRLMLEKHFPPAVVSPDPTLRISAA